MTVWMCAGMFTGCSFNQWGRDLGEGLVDGAGEQADTIGIQLVKGLTGTLTDSLTKRELSLVVSQLGDTLVSRVTAVRDSLLGVYTEQWLSRARSNLVGAETKKEIAALREELIGQRSRLLLADLRNELLGEATRGKVDSLRAVLLGSGTRMAIDSLITASITSIALGYEQNIKPKIMEQEGLVKKYATQILWTGGGVSAGLLILGGILFSRYKKSKKALEVMTYQIDKIPDEKAYDELTHRIKDQAKKESVEPFLRKVLAEQGIN